jgi:hypothetical protein
MGLPGWAINPPTTVGELTLLPRGATLQSDPNGVVADINTNVTTGGTRYSTVFFEREIQEWTFRFPQDENAQFRAMYTAARADDIYFVPDSSDMATVLQVRGEDPNYRPRNVGGKWNVSGGLDGELQSVFDWTFVISTEQSAVMIED